MSSTSKIAVAIVIVAIVAVGVVLAFRQKTPQPQTMAPREQTDMQAQTAAPSEIATPTTPAATGRIIAVNLTAQNNSGQTGTATFTDLMNGKTKVEVKIIGAPQGISQPSHIHTGTCANAGAVKYPLNAIMNGSAETTLDVSLGDILVGLPLYINAHKSTAEVNVFTACGDIKDTNASAPQTVAPLAQVNDDRQGGGGTFSTPTDRRRGADKPED